MSKKIRTIVLIISIAIISISMILVIFAPEIVNIYSDFRINYEFYVFIKWIIFIFLSLILFILYKQIERRWILIIIFLIFLYNPFIVIPLNRSIWIVIDIFTVIYLVVILYLELNGEMRKMIKQNKAQKLVKILTNFTVDTPMKYTTHLWDFGNVKNEHVDFNGFIEKIEVQWKTIEKELKELSPNLHSKIYNFLLNESNNKSWCSKADIDIGWSSLDKLDDWCNNGNEPFDFKLNKAYEVNGQTISTFGEVIVLFKREIEVRNENNMLEDIFLQQKKKLGRKFQMELIKLKGRSFYTDVERFKKSIDIIFDEIKKRQKFNKIEVEVSEQGSDSIEIKIVQFDSKSGRSAKEMIDEINDGDWKMLKDNLQNLCDWSIESSYEDENYRVNYLRDLKVKEIEMLSNVPRGFTHILRFYK